MIQSTGQKDGFDSLISVQAVGVPGQVGQAQHSFLEEKFKFKCLQWRALPLELSQGQMSLHLFYIRGSPASKHGTTLNIWVLNLPTSSRCLELHGDLDGVLDRFEEQPVAGLAYSF